MMSHRKRLSALQPDEIALLELLTERLRRLLGDRLDRVVLFGSKARGDADARSDIDVAIIVRDLDRQTKRNVLDTIADVELERSHAIGAIVFSDVGFQQFLDRERRIALDIVNEGIVL